mmetsp:Transcript_38287/g.123163  ORF Transcript_38287/g.123163 Transcript_38287/m.123163 type:complete len:318 (+) Transcript_38287:232-1185(+)
MAAALSGGLGLGLGSGGKGSGGARGAGGAGVHAETTLTHIVRSWVEHRVGSVGACPDRAGARGDFVAEVAGHNGAGEQPVNEPLHLGRPRAPGGVGVVEHAFDAAPGGDAHEAGAADAFGLERRPGRNVPGTFARGSGCIGLRAAGTTTFERRLRQQARQGGPSARQRLSVVPQKLDLHRFRLAVEPRAPVAGGGPLRVDGEDEAAGRGLEVDAEGRAARRALGVASHGHAGGERAVPARAAVVDLARAGQGHKLELALEADCAASVLIVVCRLLTGDQDAAGVRCINMKFFSAGLVHRGVDGWVHCVFLRRTRAQS